MRFNAPGFSSAGIPLLMLSTLSLSTLAAPPAVAQSVAKGKPAPVSGKPTHSRRELQSSYMARVTRADVAFEAAHKASQPVEDLIGKIKELTDDVSLSDNTVANFASMAKLIEPLASSTQTPFDTSKFASLRRQLVAAQVALLVAHRNASPT